MDEVLAVDPAVDIKLRAHFEAARRRLEDAGGDDSTAHAVHVDGLAGVRTRATSPTAAYPISDESHAGEGRASPDDGEVLLLDGDDAGAVVPEDDDEDGSWAPAVSGRRSAASRSPGGRGDGGGGAAAASASAPRRGRRKRPLGLLSAATASPAKTLLKGSPTRLGLRSNSGSSRKRPLNGQRRHREGGDGRPSGSGGGPGAGSGVSGKAAPAATKVRRSERQAKQPQKKYWMLDQRPRSVTDDLTGMATSGTQAQDKEKGIGGGVLVSPVSTRESQAKLIEDTLSEDSWDFDEPEGLAEQFVEFPQLTWASRPPAAWPATFEVVDGKRHSVVRFFFTYNNWPQADFYARDENKHKLMAKPKAIGMHEYGVILEAPIPMEQFTDGHKYHWLDRRVTMTVAEHVELQLRQFINIGLNYHETSSQALGHWLRHRRDIATDDEDVDIGIMQELYLPEGRREPVTDPNCEIPSSIMTKPFHYYFRPLPSGDVVWYTSLSPFFHNLCMTLRWLP